MEREAVRMRFLATIRNSNVDKKCRDDELPVRLCNYTDVYYNDRIDDPSNFMKATATVDEVNQFTLRKGQVLITKDSETPRDIGIPAYVASDLPGVVCGYHLTQLTPESPILGSFLFWSLMSRRLGSWFETSANGVTRFSLGQDAIRNAPIPLPSLAAQRKIADFLDRETGRIDALIDKKRRLIDLLEEKRTATITHAVTKGLDPTAPMKDSGIPWIGEIPEHWTIARLKSLVSEPLKYGANESATEANPEHPRYIRTTDIREGGTLEEETYRSLPPEVASPYTLRDGDLLLTRSGATVGKSFLYDRAWGPSCFAGYLIRARLDSRLAVPQYVSLFLRSDTYWSQVESSTIQATIMNFSAERYGDILVPLPPIGEQQAIASGLMSQGEHLRELGRLLDTELSLLAEYREALITAAVTGEIDVDTFDGGQATERTAS